LKYLEKHIESMMKTPSVSGYEKDFARQIQEKILPFVDKTEIDTLGNLIAYKKGTGKNKLKIMLSAHMDQIGLMITKIEENGILRFAPIGGINPLTLYGKRISIFTGKTTVTGIIGMKPPHLSDPSNNKPEAISELFIDCGFMDSKTCSEKITVGDLALVDFEFQKLKNNHYSCSGFDNKAGVLTILSAAEILSAREHYHDVIYLFSVQEEVGCRGAKVGTFFVEPDIALICDVTFGDPKGNISDVKTGEGPALAKGPNYHPYIISRLEELAETEDIPFQVEIESRPGGTDAYVTQVSRSGVFSALISIPLRYMHTQVEIINLKDIYRASKLMADFVNQENVIPENELMDEISDKKTNSGIK